ncbi:MAG TPA: Hsp20/alpha crystallin family protein [Chthonomonadaceae bacterium]|nr:Hsp20/alpha crystallin family protein [Chthonomonadaceae bacterium]
MWYNRQNWPGAIARRPQGMPARPSGATLLSRFDPWGEFEDMQRRMDMLFSRFFGAPTWDWSANWGGQAIGAEPDVDIYETDNEYIIQAALPGVDPKDIHIEATEDSIALSAQCRSQFEGQGQPVNVQPQGQTPQGTQSQGTTQTTTQTGTPSAAGQANLPAQQQPYVQHRQSRFSGIECFQFSTTLPAEIDPNAVKANFRNGMLELRLPKRQAPTSKRIPISVQAEGVQQAGASSAGQSQAGAQSTEHAGRAEQRPAEQAGTTQAQNVPVQATE